MASDDEFEAGGSLQSSSRDLLEQLKLANFVSDRISKQTGPYNGDKDRTEQFLLTVDMVFEEFKVPLDIQVRCVTATLSEKLTERWRVSSQADPTLKTSWAAMKPWFEQFGAHDNPRLKAATMLKKLRLSGDVSARLKEFEDACSKLKLDDKQRNLFLIAALDTDVVALVLSLHGNEWESWNMQDLRRRVLPLCERRPQQAQAQSQGQQQRKQNAGRPAEKEKNSSAQKPAQDFAALLRQLESVELPGSGGSYKPKDVAALKASLSTDTNPEAAKLKTFCSKHGLCFICRNKGHMASDCPAKNSDRAASK